MYYKNWINNPNSDEFTNSSNDPYYGHIENWNTSSVTNMSNLFSNLTYFESSEFSKLRIC